MKSSKSAQLARELTDFCKRSISSTALFANSPAGKAILTVVLAVLISGGEPDRDRPWNKQT